MMFILLVFSGRMYVFGQAVSGSMDTDIMLMRQNGAPAFNCQFDSYTRFVPGVGVLGLKLCGLKCSELKGMTSWGNFAVSSAFSAVIMASVTEGLKYGVKRTRPDLSADNSFPSGHAATSFMLATILHKEYGQKFPWISFIGYGTAALSSAGRILNNKHWMSDVVTGAAIGIGSVHLGYYLSSLIFKDKSYQSDWQAVPIMIDPMHRYWGLDLTCGRRFILADKSLIDSSQVPLRSSVVAAELFAPVHPRFGLLANLGCSSMTCENANSFNAYNATVGMSYNLPFARVMEFQTKAALGYAWHKMAKGLDVQAGASLAVLAGNNFKIKAFAQYELMPCSNSLPYFNSIVLGWSTGFCW